MAQLLEVTECNAPDILGLRTRHRVEALLQLSSARRLEVQSSDDLLTVLLHAFGERVITEKLVFRDSHVSTWPSRGAVLRRTTPEEALREAMNRRQGGGEWVLELAGQAIGSGGILFHDNPPYGDLHREIAEPFRRQGYGRYLVQELKRACYDLGALPAARCSPENTASRGTLLRAGLEPWCVILNADVRATSGRIAEPAP